MCHIPRGVRLSIRGKAHAVDRSMVTLVALCETRTHTTFGSEVSRLRNGWWTVGGFP